MKCLSVRQPWAQLIVIGEKDVENRTWRTNYRGPLLIRASLRMDEFDAGYLASEVRACGYDWPDTLPVGGIIGVATLADCVTEHESDWFDGPVGWVLAEARAVPFHPLRGRLGLYDVDDDLACGLIARALAPQTRSLV
ncbi:MAG: ASCH domain-containing protein [Anaerolineae bacterium]